MNGDRLSGKLASDYRESNRAVSRAASRERSFIVRNEGGNTLLRINERHRLVKGSRAGCSSKRGLECSQFREPRNNPRFISDRLRGRLLLSQTSRPTTGVPTSSARVRAGLTNAEEWKRPISGDNFRLNANGIASAPNLVRLTSPRRASLPDRR